MRHFMNYENVCITVLATLGLSNTDTKNSWSLSFPQTLDVVTPTYWVNPSKRGGLAGLHLGISLGL